MICGCQYCAERRMSRRRRNPAKRPPPTPAQKAKAVALCRDTNLTYKQIADQISRRKQWAIPSATVRNWCIAAGARQRPVSTPNNALGKQIRSLREHLGLTQKEFGMLVARAIQGKQRKSYWGGLALAPSTYIERWEKGAMPGLHTDKLTGLDALWAIKRIAIGHQFPLVIEASWLEKFYPIDDADLQDGFYEPITPIYDLPMPPKRYKVYKTWRKRPRMRYYPRRRLKRYRRNPGSIDARLREAEKEYNDFPTWETWGKYNWLRRQAGLSEISLPKEKGTINVLPSFWLTATLGKYTKLLHQNTTLNFSQIARHDDVKLSRTTVRDIITAWKKRQLDTPKRRNPDEPLRKLEREAARGGNREAYYRALLRVGPIPSVAKAHKKLIKAINNFPMARSYQVNQQYGRPLNTRMTNKPFLQDPEGAIEYILPTPMPLLGDPGYEEGILWGTRTVTGGLDKMNIDAALRGETPIVDLVDSLDRIMDRAHQLIEPPRIAGGGEVFPGLQQLHYGNYRQVEEAARGLAKAAAEVRFVFHEDEKNMVWVLATELIHNVFEQVPREARHVDRNLKSLERRIVEFRKRIISKSRISDMLGQISSLAGIVHSVDPAASIRIYNLKIKFEYLIVPLLMLSKKMGARRRLRRR